MKIHLSLFAAFALSACVFAESATDTPQPAAITVEQALADPAAARLAKPTPGQIEWADMEREMFLCLDPCSWQGREYDNHTTKLSDMKLEKLDVEQWIAAAKSWDAKQIVLVCKHTGGFCWWPTDTTDYCVRNIPWKDGKGNLVKDVADACRKHGLTLGIYIYSDDPKYMKGIGRGGRTDDPKKQEEWNNKLRQQWTEVLTLCGPDIVREVWFDGGCIVPLKDIIEKLAPQAQILGGPNETVRWPGSESGKLPYPSWSSIPTDITSTSTKNRVYLGVGDPDGGKWCPSECDTVLYGNGGHNWFWSAQNEAKRHTLENLMEIYLRSVGRGGVLLLNSTPNTDGLIPDGDMQTYAAFGAELQRRFGTPLAKTQGVGETVELDLGGLKKVNQAWIMEDIRGGHRIRAYALEGRTADGKWQPLTTGISVGHKRIETFPDTPVDRLRLRITKKVGTPIIRELAAFYAEGAKGTSTAPADARPKPCGKWAVGAASVKLDLTPHISMPATYEVTLAPAGKVKIVSATLLFNGTELPADDYTISGNIVTLRQTQQVTAQTRTELVVKFASGTAPGTASIRMISE